MTDRSELSRRVLPIVLGIAVPAVVYGLGLLWQLVRKK